MEAGIGDRIARGEVIRALGDDVVEGDEGAGVVRIDPRDVFLDLHMRVQPLDEARRRNRLARADILRAEDDLPLQVRQRDMVVVDDADGADAGGGEIGEQRRTEPAGADHQHPRALQPCLSGAADLRQHQMAGIALDLGVAQHHALRIRPIAPAQQSGARDPERGIGGRESGAMP